MNKINKTENTVSNIWAAQENLIHFYKTTSIACGFLTIFILIFTIIAYFRDPIVVVRTGKNNEFYATNRNTVTVDKTDVENFVRQYLKALYSWDTFDIQQLEGEIRPFSEDELVVKILDTQNKKFGKLKDKKLSQDISFVAVKVLDNSVLCSFTRVLKIDGIPIVIPTELSFSLTQGKRNKSNQVGIYVTGITESEHEK